MIYRGGRQVVGFGDGFDITKPDSWASTAQDLTNQVLAPLNDLVNQQPWLKDAVSSFSDEEKKFATSAEGQTLLRALTTSLYASAVVASGGMFGLYGFAPQIASAVFALPGLAKGDSFDKAWVDEFTWRAGKAAEMVTSDPNLAKQFGASLPDQIKSLGDSFKGQFGKLNDWANQLALQKLPGVPTSDALKQLGLPKPADLAKQLGIRPDIAAAFENFVSKQNLFDLNSFDPKTGLEDAAVYFYTGGPDDFALKVLLNIQDAGLKQVQPLDVGAYQAARNANPVPAYQAGFDLALGLTTGDGQKEAAAIPMTPAQIRSHLSSVAQDGFDAGNAFIQHGGIAATSLQGSAISNVSHLVLAGYQGTGAHLAQLEPDVQAHARPMVVQVVPPGIPVPMPASADYTNGFFAGVGIISAGGPTPPDLHVVRSMLSADGAKGFDAGSEYYRTKHYADGKTKALSPGTTPAPAPTTTPPVQAPPVAGATASAAYGPYPR